MRCVCKVCESSLSPFSLTNTHAQEKYPAEYAARDDDKYNYRYPRGESYKDIVVRLEPMTMELERAHNVLGMAEAYPWCA